MAATRANILARPMGEFVTKRRRCMQKINFENLVTIVDIIK